MRKTNILSLIGLSCIALPMMVACMSEEPFQNETEHLVRMNVSLNTGITRGDIEGESLQTLLNNCVVYISDEKGLLFKWQGTQNIPQQGVYLRYGKYVAEAWSGDSVGASFTSKFYKGMTPFAIGDDNVTTQVNISCKLANVVASVDPSALSSNLVSGLAVTVANAGSELEFKESTLFEKGYFMRPYNHQTKEYDSKFEYTVKGIDIDGSEFRVSGEIDNALPGHEYRLVLENNPNEDDNQYGGFPIKIKVEDYELFEDQDAWIFGPPQFAWEGSAENVETQLTRSGDSFEAHSLLIGAADGFKSLMLSTDNEDLKKNFAGESQIEIIGISTQGAARLSALGLEIVKSIDGEEIRTKGYKLVFNTEWFNALPKSENPYEFIIRATDASGKTSSAKVSILNSDNPVILDVSNLSSDLLAVGAKEAKINYSILKENLPNAAIQYRKVSDTNWTTISLGSTRAEDKGSYKLTGLTPDTEYECRIVGGEITDGEYEFASAVGSFKTEGIFEIPNYSLESWYKNGKYFVPGEEGKDYWGTGNAGSTTISSNDNLTIQFTDFYHSGNSCAQMTSKFVGIAGLIGKHGAASLFTGSFAGTEQTTHGIIDLGREYNGSHPKAVRVWVNYRPKAATSQGGNNNYIPKGELDKGQIYIALSTDIHRARTAYPETLITQDNLPSEFVAYGQRTFEEDFGKDNTLEEVVIPFEYFESAHTKAPKYLIILCAASKYGDYFSGGEGSTMYVDDFELIYE